jgi:hypothetical protein
MTFQILLGVFKGAALLGQSETPLMYQHLSFYYYIPIGRAFQFRIF